MWALSLGPFGTYEALYLLATLWEFPLLAGLGRGPSGAGSRWPVSLAPLVPHHQRLMRRETHWHI